MSNIIGSIITFHCSIRYHFSFLQHLASYAIGRSLTFNELEYLKNEGKKALGPGGYRMKDCVLFVVQSPMFMEK